MKIENIENYLCVNHIFAFQKVIKNRIIICLRIRQRLVNKQIMLLICNKLLHREVFERLNIDYHDEILIGFLMDEFLLL